MQPPAAPGGILQHYTHVELRHADIDEGAEHDDKVKGVPRVAEIVL